MPRRDYSEDLLIQTAATETIAAVMTLDHVRTEAAAGKRADFLLVVDAVPGISPPPGEALP